MSSLTAAVDLPVTDFTVRDARVIALGVAAAWDTGVSHEDLTLLVDDLTADVVDHAGGESSLVLELSLDDELLRVGLADGSAVRPVARDVTVLGPSWALADRWGDEPYRGGHRIWFELRSVRPRAGAVREAPGLGPRELRDALTRVLGSAGPSRPRHGVLRRAATIARARLASRFAPSSRD